MTNLNVDEVTALAKALPDEALLREYADTLAMIDATGGYFETSEVFKLAVKAATAEILWRMSFAPKEDS